MSSSLVFFFRIRLVVLFIPFEYVEDYSDYKYDVKYIIWRTVDPEFFGRLELRELRAVLNFLLKSVIRKY